MITQPETHQHAPIMPPPELDGILTNAHIFLNAVFGDENGQADVNRLLEMDDANMLSLSWEFVHEAEGYEDSAERHQHNCLCLLKLMQYFAGLAGKDGLTGLFNKISFQDMLQERIDLLNREVNAFYVRREEDQANNAVKTSAVLFVDLDKFKPVNDTYGHAVGDEVLKLAAKTLKQVRLDDIVGRVGGDEFVVLLNNLTAEEAVSVRERIDTVLNNLQLSITHEGIEKTIHIGGSVGLAVLEAGMTAKDIEECADKDMYERKKAKKVERQPG